jgi:hypothetical protein
VSRAEEHRQKLAEALNGNGHLGCEEFDPNDLDSGCPDCEDLLRAADALLPVVQRIADEAAAEALEEAADEAHREAYTDGRLPWQVLRDRAAAYRARGTS